MLQRLPGSIQARRQSITIVSPPLPEILQGSNQRAGFFENHPSANMRHPAPAYYFLLLKFVAVVLNLPDRFLGAEAECPLQARRWCRSWRHGYPPALLGAGASRGVAASTEVVHKLGLQIQARSAESTFIVKFLCCACAFACLHFRA